MKTFPGLALWITFAAVCNGRGSAQEWIVKREFVVSEPGGAGTFWGSISGVAVAPRKFFVFDRQESRLYGFDERGDLLWQAGRRGAAPGEFSQSAVSVVLTNQGFLVVPDLGNGRLSVFDTNGKFQTSYPFQVNGGTALEWFALGDRVVYGMIPMGTSVLARAVGEHRIKDAIYVMRSLLGQEQKLFSLPHPATYTVDADNKLVISVARPVSTVASDGRHLYAVSSEAYRIEFTSPLGGPSGTLERKVEPVQLSSAARKRMEESGQRLKDQLPAALKSYSVSFLYPRLLPAVHSMIAGDSLLIVRRGDIATRDTSTYDVF